MLEITIRMIGPPGSGKTRAARAIAHALGDISGIEYDVKITSSLDGETEPTLEYRCRQERQGSGYKVDSRWGE